MQLNRTAKTADVNPVSSERVQLLQLQQKYNKNNQFFLYKGYLSNAVIHAPFFYAIWYVFSF